MARDADDAGLRIAVQPVPRTGAVLRVAMAAAKFHGWMYVHYSSLCKVQNFSDEVISLEPNPKDIVPLKG
jgi:hypothetical protein